MRLDPDPVRAAWSLELRGIIVPNSYLVTLQLE